MRASMINEQNPDFGLLVSTLLLKSLLEFIAQVYEGCRAFICAVSEQRL